MYHVKMCACVIIVGEFSHDSLISMRIQVHSDSVICFTRYLLSY